MTTTRLESDGTFGQLVAVFGAFRKSPANLLLALGIVLFVLGAFVLRVGVWAAIFGIWGIALVLVGAGVRTVVWWIRR